MPGGEQQSGIRSRLPDKASDNGFETTNCFVQTCRVGVSDRTGLISSGGAAKKQVGSVDSTAVIWQQKVAVDE
jgi:hypothetical protein